MMACPFTEGLGCAIGAGLSRLAFASSLKDAALRCSSGEGSCGGALFTAGLHGVAAYAPARLAKYLTAPAREGASRAAQLAAERSVDGWDTVLSLSWDTVSDISSHYVHA